MCGIGCKRSLILEIEVSVSVYLITIRLYIPVAIKELIGCKTIFNPQPSIKATPL